MGQTQDKLEPNYFIVFYSLCQMAVGRQTRFKKIKISTKIAKKYIFFENLETLGKEMIMKTDKILCKCKLNGHDNEN